MKTDGGIYKRHKFNFLQVNKGEGEMVSWLKSFVALVEDLGMIPTTYIAAHSSHNCSSRGSSGICGHQIHIQDTYAHSGKILKYIRYK